MEFDYWDLEFYAFKTSPKDSGVGWHSRPDQRDDPCRRVLSWREASFRDEEGRTSFCQSEFLKRSLECSCPSGLPAAAKQGVYVAPEGQWRTVLSFHFSRSLEDQKIAEMIEVRKIIETELCTLSAKRAGPKDIEALKESLDEMKAHIDDPVAFAKSDQQFHLSIARAAQNSLLGDFIEKIHDLLSYNISLIIQKSNISKRSLDFHQRIYEAIRDADGARARKVMAAHIADVEKEFVKILYQPAGSS